VARKPVAIEYGLEQHGIDCRRSTRIVQRSAIPSPSEALGETLIESLSLFSARSMKRRVPRGTTSTISLPSDSQRCFRFYGEACNTLSHRTLAPFVLAAVARTRRLVKMPSRRKRMETDLYRSGTILRFGALRADPRDFVVRAETILITRLRGLRCFCHRYRLHLIFYAPFERIHHRAFIAIRGFCRRGAFRANRQRDRPSRPDLARCGFIPGSQRAAIARSPIPLRAMTSPTRPLRASPFTGSG